MKISKFDPLEAHIDPLLDMRVRYGDHIEWLDMSIRYGAHIEHPYRTLLDMQDQRLDSFTSWSLGSPTASMFIHKVFGGPTFIKFALW